MYREVHSGFGSVSASDHGAFERLEPVDWKLSNPVLRGGGLATVRCYPTGCDAVDSEAMINFRAKRSCTKQH